MTDAAPAADPWAAFRDPSPAPATTPAASAAPQASPTAPAPTATPDTTKADPWAAFRDPPGSAPAPAPAAPTPPKRGSEGQPPDPNVYNNPDIYGGLAPVATPEASQHFVQGAEKAVIGTAGLPGDLSASAQRRMEDSALADEQGLKADPWSFDENGVPLRFTDAQGKPARPDRSKITTPAPSFMGSEMLTQPLRGTVLDPDKLPADSLGAQLTEAGGGLIANLPLAMVGGEAAPALSMAERAQQARPVLNTVGRWAASGVKGAAGGGAGAFVETPGDVSERLDAAGSGALVGAGLGLGLPPAAAVVNYIGRRLFDGSVKLPGNAGSASRFAAEKAGQEYAGKLGPEGVARVQADAQKPATEGYASTVGQAAPYNSGAVEMERTARAKAPADAQVAARRQIDSELGAIRTQAGDGSPADTSAHLTSEQARISTEGQEKVDQALAGRQTAVDALPPPAYKDKPAGLDSDVVEFEDHEGNPDEAPAWNNATSDSPHVTAAEQYGAGERANILESRQAAEDLRSRVQGRINQDGNVVVPTDPIRHNIEERYTLGRYETAPQGEEAAILADLQSLPQNAPLADLQSLNRRVTQEIDNLTPPGTRMPEPARRLLSVKQSIADAIDEGAKMHLSMGDPGPFPEPRTGPSPVSTLRGDQRFMTGQEAWDHARVKELNQTIASTYNDGVVGSTLRFGDGAENNFASGAKDLVTPNVTRAGGSFAVSDAEVMGKIWDGGVNEGANVRQFAKADGSVDKLKAWAADDLRDKALDEKTGDLDPVKYAKWRRDHRAGLNSLPELKKAFDGVEAAQASVQAAQEAKAAASSAFETTSVKHLLNKRPDEAVRDAFETGDAAKNIADIQSKIKGNPDAVSGFRKAVGDYIENNYRPLTDAGTTNADRVRAAKFNKFLADNEGILRSIYGDDGYDKFLAPIGRQMTDRATASPANRARAANGNGNGNGHGNVGATLALTEAGLEAAKIIPHGEKLTAAAIGTARLVRMLRSKGIQTRGHLINQGALDTNVGRYLMQLQRPDVSTDLLGRLAAAIGASAGGNPISP